MDFLVWMLVAVFGLLVSAVVFVASSYIINRARDRKDRIGAECAEVAGKVDSRRVVILLSGLFGRAQEQFKPVLPVFTKNSRVELWDYRSAAFGFIMPLLVLSGAVHEHLKSGRHVTVVGASLGGLIAIRLAEIFSHEHNLRVIMIDTPSGGSADLKGMPGGAALLFRLFVFAPIPNWIGNRILDRKARKATGPSPLDVEFPEGTDKNEVLGALRKQARQALHGWNFDLWWSQLSSIVTFRWNKKSPLCDDAANVEVIYLACIGEGNLDIDQPRAGKTWQARGIRGLEVAAIKTPHCSFWAQPAQWRRALNAVVNRPPRYMRT